MATTLDRRCNGWGKLLQFSPRRQGGLVRRITAGVRRELRRASEARRRMLITDYRQIVRHGVFRGLARPAIGGEVAARMFDEALAGSAGESDLGLFGPWIFLRDAEELVDAALDGDPRPTGSRPRALTPLLGSQ